MGTRHELARAMQTLTGLRQRHAHGNAIHAAERRLRAVALACDTIHGDADPHAWAADWLVAVSSGHADYPHAARIAAEFRRIISTQKEAA